MPELKRISVALCNPHPDNPRENFEDEGILASIREHGVLTPAIVWGRATGEYTVLAGHRRTFASHELDVPTIPAVVFAEHELTEEKAQFILLEENIKHKTLEPVEEARAIASRITKFGLTQQQVADEYRRSVSWVSRRLSLLPPEQQPEKKDGRGRPPAPVSDVFAARQKQAPSVEREMKAAPVEAQPAVAKAVENQKLSTREAANLVKAVKKAPPEKQKEIAEKAAESPDPVSTAEHLSGKAIHESNLQKERQAVQAAAVHPDLVWEGSHGDMATSYANKVSGKIIKLFWSLDKIGQEPRYDIFDDSEILGYHREEFQRIRDWAQRHLDLCNEELQRRSAGKKATVTHLRPVGGSNA